MIRNSGTEPEIILYLETPPSRDTLTALIADMGISVRDLLRKNVEPYEQLGLAEDKFTDDQLIDFMLQHPILINRPIVVTPLGTACADRLKSSSTSCRMRRKGRLRKRMAKPSWTPAAKNLAKVTR
jgi:arsenate reductase (glutaredoxin)